MNHNGEKAAQKVIDSHKTRMNGAKVMLETWISRRIMAWLRVTKKDIQSFYHAVWCLNWQIVRTRRWYRDCDADLANATRLLTFPLTEKSLVIDVGGYQGDWTQAIVDKYHARVLVLEPVPAYYRQIYQRFKNVAAVKVFNLGLLDRDDKMRISVAAEGSSLFGQRPDVRALATVRVEDVDSFLAEQGCERIDLMKLNIEGSEYPVLRRLLEVGRLPTIAYLLVQFHTSYPRAHRLRRELRRQLRQTHECVFNYPFVWECWRIKTYFERSRMDACGM